MTSTFRKVTTHYDPYPRQVAAPAARVYAPARPKTEYLAPAIPPGEPQAAGLRLDGLAVAALIVAVFLIFQSIRDRTAGQQLQETQTKTGQTAETSPETVAASPPSAPDTAEAQEQESPPVPLPPAVPDPAAISYPYDEYWLTQGPHGFSYGHMAIDLAAGKGEPIKSPIHGQIAANYVDEYGNTTLVIENEVYAVTLLHGNYSAQVGQKVGLGDIVGSEWNNGYTLDMNGRSCRNRDCGYHTHMNVYNKVIQSNVNPLDVLP